ncbi:hypothetical protein K1719_038044 [Acacia pycnantha]|nr:hypothetical protein K1719_038044 [Acacia pycnantha]
MDSVRSEDTKNGEMCDRVGHRNGIRVSSSVNRLNTARKRMRRRSMTTVKCCHCVPRCQSLLHSSSEFLSSIPSHAVFIFLNPLMVDLLQLDYQNKKVSPFETHAPTMWIFFVSTCMHCLGLAFEMKIHSLSVGSFFCRIFTNVVLFAGALSSISLASTFLPPPLSWACLGLWALFPFVIGFPLLVSALRWLCEKAMEFLMKCFSAEKLSHLPK